MMMSVIGRAMMPTSISATIRFEKFWADRKTGESPVPSPISTTMMTTRSDSQRARPASRIRIGRSSRTATECSASPAEPCTFGTGARSGAGVIDRSAPPRRGASVGR